MMWEKRRLKSWPLFRSRMSKRGWHKQESRKRRRTALMKKIPLSEVKDDLSKFLRLAEKEQIVITRHGKPAGVLIGFEGDDDWFDFCLENDPRFAQRIAAARKSLRAGRGIRLEDVS